MLRTCFRSYCNVLIIRWVAQCGYRLPPSKLVAVSKWICGIQQLATEGQMFHASVLRSWLGKAVSHDLRLPLVYTTFTHNMQSNGNTITVDVTSHSILHSALTLRGARQLRLDQEASTGSRFVEPDKQRLCGPPLMCRSIISRPASCPSKNLERPCNLCCSVATLLSQEKRGAAD